MRPIAIFPWDAAAADQTIQITPYGAKQAHLWQ